MSLLYKLHKATENDLSTTLSCRKQIKLLSNNILKNSYKIS